jgi:phosphohistidine phosphatase
MNVYLVRHGIAVESWGPHGSVRDEDRRLSDEGRKKTREVARGLRLVIGDEALRIVSSPLVRARETAEIFAEEFGVETPVELLADLVPGGDADAVAEWLELQVPGPVMLVGHMPSIADVASCLASSGDGVGLVFKKAAVMRVCFEARAGRGKGCIEWFLPPGFLRRVVC